MSFTNFESREINCKVIYVGPDGAGKTENLKSIYHFASKSHKMPYKSLQSPLPDYFDFLPLSLGYVKDFHIKIHLFTLNMSTPFKTMSKVLFRGVDGIIFVADSAIESMIDNLECMSLVQDHLMANGLRSTDIPMIIQYNKRDLKDCISKAILRKELNSYGYTDFEAIAHKSVGTMESLHAMSQKVLESLAPQAS